MAGRSVDEAASVAQPSAEDVPTVAQASDPVVSVVIPTYEEREYLPATLDSVAAQATDLAHEVVVVDGGSTDGTVQIAREYGARVIEQSGSGIAAARDEGARAARGEWLAFVDADTRLDPRYLDAMLSFVRRRDLVAAAARCRMDGPRRVGLLEFITNRVFPRMSRPVLPGFTLFVSRDAYERVGGFPDVPNEDKALSRALGAVGETAYHPERLVETSGRRVAADGLVGTLAHYLRLDLAALRSGGGDDRLARATLAAMALAVVAGFVQLYHGLVVGHLTATLAAAGFFGGVALFMMDLLRPRVVAGGLAFLGWQVGYWLYLGQPHGTFGVVNAALLVAIAGTLVYGIARQRAGDDLAFAEEADDEFTLGDGDGETAD